MPKPSIMHRARGYGKMAELQRQQDMYNNPDWRDVPGFPEYEVNQLRQVRRKGTHAPTRPYTYPMRPLEGEFVDFWVDLRKHTMSLDTIMTSVFEASELPPKDVP